MFTIIAIIQLNKNEISITHVRNYSTMHKTNIRRKQNSKKYKRWKLTTSYENRISHPYLKSIEFDTMLSIWKISILSRTCHIEIEGLKHLLPFSATTTPLLN